VKRGKRSDGESDWKERQLSKRGARRGYNKVHSVITIVIWEVYLLRWRRRGVWEIER